MKYRLSDNVLRRIVQVMQEGLLTGTDVTDHMRMIRLTPSDDDADQLVMTEDYQHLVESQHEAMLREIDDFKLQEN
jgi:hypothetical protein